MIKKLVNNIYFIPALLVAILVALIVNIAVTAEVYEGRGRGERFFGMDKDGKEAGCPFFNKEFNKEGKEGVKVNNLPATDNALKVDDVTAVEAPIAE